MNSRSASLTRSGDFPGAACSSRGCRSNVRNSPILPSSGASSRVSHMMWLMKSIRRKAGPVRIRIRGCCGLGQSALQEMDLDFAVVPMEMETARWRVRLPVARVFVRYPAGLLASVVAACGSAEPPGESGRVLPVARAGINGVGEFGLRPRPKSAGRCARSPGDP